MPRALDSEQHATINVAMCSAAQAPEHPPLFGGPAGQADVHWLRSAEARDQVVYMRLGGVQTVQGRQLTRHGEHFAQDRGEAEVLPRKLRADALLPGRDEAAQVRGVDAWPWLRWPGPGRKRRGGDGGGRGGRRRGGGKTLCENVGQ